MIDYRPMTDAEIAEETHAAVATISTANNNELIGVACQFIDEHVERMIQDRGINLADEASHSAYVFSLLAATLRNMREVQAEANSTASQAEVN